MTPTTSVAPADSGALFVLFSTSRPWRVPWKSWHVDHGWHDPKAPLRELKVHAHFGVAEARAGGMTIVVGSHHVVDAIVRSLPPFRRGTRAEVIRRTIMRAHPYLRAPGTEVGDDAAAHRTRIERFVDREEELLGFPVRVVENTAAPGDVLLMHPLILHTRPTHARTTSRFLLNKDLYQRRVGGPAQSSF